MTSQIKSKPHWSNKLFLGSAHFALKEQVFFAKRLAFLINAGVPLPEGLHMLRDQTRGRGATRVLQSVVDDVQNGQTLSRAFSKFPRVFGDFTISIVRVGESSGTLSTSLNHLAEELKKKQMLKRKVQSAFVYPVVILCATLGIVAFMMLYLFPKITPIFTSLNATLPRSTLIVMAASNFLQAWGFLVVGISLVATVLLILLYKKIPVVRYGADYALLRLPLIGTVLKEYNIANTTRTLGLLLKSGMRLSEVLPIVADTTHNSVYRRHFRRVSSVVARGEKISVYLQKNDQHFPDMMAHLVEVGERSGTLSETLSYLAELYEHEVDEFTKNLSTLIEPVLMIGMGLLVGFIAVSIITPIYGITQNLSR